MGYIVGREHEDIVRPRVEAGCSLYASRGIFNSNLLYDHQAILLRYMRLPVHLWLPAKVQHGWAPAYGGEWSNQEEIRINRAPLWVWNSRTFASATRDGMAWAETVGAPALYEPRLAAVADSVEPDRQAIIAFPRHSVGPDYVIADGWDAYVRSLFDLGFSRVSVCLHANDYRPEVITAIRSAGAEPVTVGSVYLRDYLLRCMALIAAHGAVTSDRVCTAGFYAGLVGRPFVVHGRRLEYGTPDPDEGPVADLAWVRQEFPEFLVLANSPHYATSLRELGMGYVKSAESLRQLLWGDENPLTAWKP